MRPVAPQDDAAVGSKDDPISELAHLCHRHQGATDVTNLEHGEALDAVLEGDRQSLLPDIENPSSIRRGVIHPGSASHRVLDFEKRRHRGWADVFRRAGVLNIDSGPAVLLSPPRAIHLTAVLRGLLQI